MLVTLDVAAPWEVALSVGQRELIFYSFAVAALALLAHLVHGWLSTGEVSPRYRAASYASTCICAIAFVSYLYLAVELVAGYDLTGGHYVPNAEARGTYLPRYADWSVTVPLLMVEALAVSSLAGARARRTRAVAMACAFLMIITGFIGVGVVGQGHDSSAMLVWGLVSTVFFAVLYVVLLGALRRSRGSMGAEAYASYRHAVVLLLSVWGWYPVAYAIHNWAAGATVTTVVQVGFSFADVAAKVGFGVLVHKVAVLRTAEDVEAGEDTHPESVWVSSVKHADAVLPPERDVPRYAAAE